VEKDELFGGGTGGKYGAKRNACRFLVAEPKQRGIFEDLRLNEKDHIKMDLKETG
jgi:hypothetical protein